MQLQKSTNCSSLTSLFTLQSSEFLVCYENKFRLWQTKNLSLLKSMQFFKRFFGGFLCFYFSDRTAEEWTGNRRDGETVPCSKGPEVESNPWPLARTKPLYMERLLYQLSHRAPQINLFIHYWLFVSIYLGYISFLVNSSQAKRGKTIFIITHFIIDNL